MEELNVASVFLKCTEVINLHNYTTPKDDDVRKKESEKDVTLPV